LGEAPLKSLSEPSPSRAITKAEASALADITHIKELLFNTHIQRRKVLQGKDNIVTKMNYLLW
jgi:hypothetical protein